MSRPGVLLEMAFGAQPLGTSFTWTDVSAYLQGYDLQQRGRTTEFDLCQSAVLTVHLNNTDGRFDPGNTSSPYYPNVVPNTPVRLSWTWGGTTYRRFLGYVDVWPRQWPGGASWSTSDVQASDGLKLLARVQFAEPYSQAVMDDSPRGYWRLNDPPGQWLGYNLGNAGNTKVFYAPQAPAGTRAGPLLSGETCPNYSAAPGGYETIQTVYPYLLTGDLTWECWVYIDQYTGGPYGILGLGNFGDLRADAAGTFSFLQSNGTTAWTATSTVQAAGVWLLLAVVKRAGVVQLYVNGAPSGSAVTFGVPAIPPTVMHIGQSQTGGPYDGGLAEVAIYPVALDAERIAVHAAAVMDTCPNELTGARVGKILNLFGWPAGQRNVDAGRHTLATWQVPLESPALTEIQAAAASEFGLVFCDESGNLTFQDGHHRFNSARSTTSQATFGDLPGEIPYRDSFTPVLDDLHIVNDAQITAADGWQSRKTDSTSQGKYGVAVFQRSGLLAYHWAARAWAQWVLALNKDPVTRIDTLTPINPFADDATLTAVLGLSISDRVTVNRRPNPGTAFSEQFYVEGYSEQVAEAASGFDWQISYTLSPADPATYFTADVSVADSTDVLAP